MHLMDESTRRNIQRFARRVLELGREAGVDTDREMAERLGIHPNTWTRYKKGTNAPDLAIITKICDEFDVSIGWLLDDHNIPIAVERTLQENERRGSGTPRITAIDVDLVDSLRYIATTVYRDAGQRLPPNQATREAAVLYNMLLERVSDITDDDEVAATLPQLKHILKRKLEQAGAAPGTGKRSVSS